MRIFLTFFLGTFCLILGSSYLQGRSIYLNGVDISNAKEQDLEGVDIKIDQDGNLYITGSHYEVYQEESIPPLVPKKMLPPTHPAHQKEPKNYSLPKDDSTSLPTETKKKVDNSGNSS